jgi:hypothetical protein
VILGTYPLRYTASAVEDGLQRSIHAASLGQRLHRCVAMGRNTEDDGRLHNPDYLCHVFMTVFRTEGPPDGGKIRVNGREMTVMY